jgi:hypothetical protein
MNTGRLYKLSAWLVALLFAVNLAMTTHLGSVIHSIPPYPAGPEDGLGD